jgi:Arc/MetJ family transcription regulator
MFICMRTTIDIQDDLLVELKRVAADSNRTLKDLVEDAIRAALALRRSGATGEARKALITFRGKSVQRSVNLDSTSELLDFMDGVR